MKMGVAQRGEKTKIACKRRERRGVKTLRVGAQPLLVLISRAHHEDAGRPEDDDAEPNDANGAAHQRQDHEPGPAREVGHAVVRAHAVERVVRLGQPGIYQVRARRSDHHCRGHGKKVPK